MGIKALRAAQRTQNCKQPFGWFVKFMRVIKLTWTSPWTLNRNCSHSFHFSFFRFSPYFFFLIKKSSKKNQGCWVNPWNPQHLRADAAETPPCFKNGRLFLCGYRCNAAIFEVGRLHPLPLWLYGVGISTDLLKGRSPFDADVIGVLVGEQMLVFRETLDATLNIEHWTLNQNRRAHVHEIPNALCQY